MIVNNINNKKQTFRRVTITNMSLLSMELPFREVII